jgi:hypothetical protein
MWQLRYAVIGFLATSAGGCGAAHQPDTSPAPQTSATPRGQQPESAGLPVQIDNQNFSDMNIYLVNGGQRWLVGQASGLAQTTLTIPRGVAPGDGRVRLLADPIGGSAPIFTGLLVVSPGQRVYWTIGSDPLMSSASAG